MDLINKKVIHKAFGEGKIIANTGEYLKIQFSDGEKDFIFPDVFKSFLEFKNSKDTELILPIIKEKHIIKQDEKMEREKQIKKERTLKLEAYRQERGSNRKSGSKRAMLASSNLAFKYNFCDGGQTDDQIGFSGLCSDDVMTKNIKQSKNIWCKSNESNCLKYHKEEITREELDQIYKNDDFVCYESMALRDWKASAGHVLSGKNKGKPKNLARAQNNTLAILTTCEPGEAEDTRYIFGVFLVGETFKGDANKEGYVSADPKYKISLSREEAQKLLFWNYYANATNPHNILWNSGMFRYFHNMQASQILKDIVAIKEGTEDEELAKDFLNYFCDVQKIDPDSIGELNGALKQDQPPTSQ